MEKEIHVIESSKNLMNNNYFKTTFLSNLKLNILIIIISIILFVIEFFYRTPLFNYSVEFEKNWQEKATKETITLFKILTKIGGEYLMAVPVIIVLWFSTLIKSFIYLMGFIFCLQFHSMMKIWYGSKRPFWIEPSLYKGICDGGFGNPSGHSITTTFLYLSLIFLYTQTKTRKNVVLIIVLLFCLFWIIMILLSRLILGMHSVNQILYGTSLGLIIISYIYIVFKIHQMPINIYKKFFREKKYIYIILSIYCVFIIITFGNVFIFNRGFDYDKYNELLDRVCEKKVPKYRRFNLDGLFGSITILAMLGMYLGQIVFWYLIENKYKYNFNEENYINNMNNNIRQMQELNINDIKFSNNIKSSNNEIINNSKSETEIVSNNSIDDIINHWNINRIYICDFKNILKLIFVLIICLLPGILFVAIKNDSNIIMVFALKIGVPMFIIPFLIYSIGFYYLIKISCGPMESLLKKLQEI